MKRLIAPIVLPVLLVAISFGSDLQSHRDRVSHEDAARAIAVAARHTERLGIALVDLSY